MLTIINLWEPEPILVFLGKGPTKNPLFQVPLEGIDQASMKQLGPGMIPAVEDAMAFATAGKIKQYSNGNFR